MNKLLMGLLILTAGSALSIAGPDNSTESESPQRLTGRLNWECIVADKNTNPDVSDLRIYKADRGQDPYGYLTSKVMVVGSRSLAEGKVSTATISSNDENNQPKTDTELKVRWFNRSNSILKELFIDTGNGNGVLRVGMSGHIEGDPAVLKRNNQKVHMDCLKKL